MIRTSIIDQKNGQITSGDLSLLNDWKNRSDCMIWMDFESEDKSKEREILEKEFNLDKLALDDAQRDRHPPKLEWFNNYYFLLIKAFNAETDSIDFGILHISFFIGKNFIITRHVGVSPSINRIWEQLQQGKIDASRGANHLCYKVVSTIIDRYTPIILNMEKRLDQLEELMLTKPNDELLTELINYNSRLKKLRRIFSYQATILSEMDNNKKIIEDDIARHEFQHVLEQMERLASLSDLFQELARDLIDGYISVTSHRLNKIMKVLTIVAVIFLPLTFLAGVYGMNFMHMPELAWKYAYFVVIGTMLFIAISLILLFKKLKWL